MKSPGNMETPMFPFVTGEFLGKRKTEIAQQKLLQKLQIHYVTEETTGSDLPCSLPNGFRGKGIQ